MKRTGKITFEKGFKRTPQRLAIMAYLEGNTSHPSAEEIFHAVVGNDRTLSFATVYNTLKTLSKAGALRELTIDPSRKRYDPNTGAHNHIICVDCQKVVDVPEEISIDLPKDVAQNFSILGNHVEFYGICPKCRKAQKSA
jgi:Fur family transcriptional regulator, peroxide stress response regulator